MDKDKGFVSLFTYYTFGAIFHPDHFKLIVVALIWLKYCRYGVKIYPINQSINKTLYGIWDNSPDILINCCTYTAGHG